MKKILLAAAALVTALTLFAGCGDNSADSASIEGTWVSADGSVLTIDNGALSLKDSMGENMLSQDVLPCEQRGSFLYLTLGDVDAKVFEVSVDEDEMTLKYTVDVQADMQHTYDQPIVLTRSEG